MRALIRCGFALGFILSLWAAPVGPAAAASLDTTADRVLGQAGFTTSAANNNSGRIAGLDTPYGALVDPHTGRLWVSDTGNNRVLSWPNAPAFSNGQAPDIVLGQPDFSSHGINTNGLSASSLAGPIGLAVDQTGDLYVADSFNNRVLRYTAPVTTHAAAVAVLGQPNFLTNTADFDGGSAAARGEQGGRSRLPRRARCGC